MQATKPRDGGHAYWAWKDHRPPSLGSRRNPPNAAKPPSFSLPSSLPVSAFLPPSRTYCVTCFKPVAYPFPFGN